MLTDGSPGTRRGDAEGAKHQNKGADGLRDEVPQRIPDRGCRGEDGELQVRILRHFKVGLVGEPSEAGSGEGTEELGREIARNQRGVEVAEGGDEEGGDEEISDAAWFNIDEALSNAISYFDLEAIRSLD